MFITLEGPDGSGKSTQTKWLLEQLKRDGFEAVFTREPGGTEISNQVRSILMNMKNKSMFPRTEILLFCSARAQLVEQIIKPSLVEGKIVISDRYADSTLAYQGYGHGFDLKTLTDLLNFTTDNLWPDLTFLLDLPAEKGLQRRISNRDEWNRMDDYQLEFHQRVREGYLKLAALQPNRWVVIDADKEAGSVGADIYRILLERLNSRSSQLS